MLMETVFAVALLCAIVYTSTSVMSQAAKSSAQDKKKWTASETASMVMEELSFSYSTADILSAGTHVRYYDYEYSEVSAGQHTYKVTWEVIENTPIQGILSINLSVSWMEGPHEHFINYKTLR